MIKKAIASSSPALRVMVAFSISLLLVAMLIAKFKGKEVNTFMIMDTRTAHNFPFVEETMETIDINETITLNFITDESGGIYYYLFEDKEILTYGSYKENNEGEEIIFGGLISGTSLQGTDYHFFSGLIDDKEIKEVSLNDQTNSIKHYHYNGYPLFYTTELVEEFVMIKGFSSENEIVYEKVYNRSE
ncbi:hypothetical protein WAK64_17520 [Bacillus spongiae]|uniref:DUF4178 domain-containing protein n=1 Tax=Bacillus spongiae TaxID=2683610 RepID=A0ABU8HI31_9BACI